MSSPWIKVGCIWLNIFRIRQSVWMENEFVWWKKQPTIQTFNTFCPAIWTLVSHVMTIIAYRELLYRDGVKLPLHPQAQWWYTSKAKVSGNFGGAASDRNDLHNLSASLFVIMPQRLDDTGIAPALLNSSNWTGVHCTQVIPSATRLNYNNGINQVCNL